MTRATFVFLSFCGCCCDIVLLNGSMIIHTHVYQFFVFTPTFTNFSFTFVFLSFCGCCGNIIFPDGDVFLFIVAVDVIFQ